MVFLKGHALCSLVGWYLKHALRVLHLWRLCDHSQRFWLSVLGIRPREYFLSALQKILMICQAWNYWSWTTSPLRVSIVSNVYLTILLMLKETTDQWLQQWHSRLFLGQTLHGYFKGSRMKLDRCSQIWIYMYIYSNII